MSSADPVEKLVRMANQIASFFRSYPEEEAKAGIHEHIVSFWTPKMRATLLAHADAVAARLDPLVTAAMSSWPRAESPIRKEVAGPGEVGQLASDAG